MLLLQPLALLLAAVAPLATVVRADTEIRNFALPLVDGRQMTIQQMPDMTLKPNTPTTLTLSSSRPHIRIALLAEPRGSWTTRVSWPASTPTRFEMDIQPGTAGAPAVLFLKASPLSPRIDHTRVLGYLGRIAGLNLWIDDNGASGGVADPSSFSTTFTVVLEPLAFGVLPRTAIPAVIAILILCASVWFVKPFLIKGFESVMRRVDAEEAQTAAQDAGTAAAEGLVKSKED